MLATPRAAGSPEPRGRATSPASPPGRGERPHERAGGGPEGRRRTRGDHRRGQRAGCGATASPGRRGEGSLRVALRPDRGRNQARRANDRPHKRGMAARPAKLKDGGGQGFPARPPLGHAEPSQCRPRSPTRTASGSWARCDGAGDEGSPPRRGADARRLCGCGRPVCLASSAGLCVCDCWACHHTRATNARSSCQCGGGSHPPSRGRGRRPKRRVACV